MTRSEHAWWASTGQKLVNTMASPTGPDVIGLLKDKTGYGVYGDHGGAQKEVQRIPMVMYAKGMKHVVSGAPFRLVDVLPTVLRTMGIRPDGSHGRQGRTSCRSEPATDLSETGGAAARPPRPFLRTGRGRGGRRGRYRPGRGGVSPGGRRRRRRRCGRATRAAAGCSR